MRIVTIIPARGGSARLPRKNLALLDGTPLVARSIEQARQGLPGGPVYVSTEDAEIAAAARASGAEVIERPAELATETAGSESALLHALDHLRAAQGGDPDLVVFLQCTSPIRQPDDIPNALRTLIEQGADSLFSAARSHGLLWRRGGQGLRSLNYDFTNRQRDQERPDEFRENGSIYVFKPWVLRRHQNRLGGKIAVYEMDYWSSFQVDSPEDLELCAWILRRQAGRRASEVLPRPVEAVIFDFDGVFTDNRVLVQQDGTESVLCDRGDGLGLSRLKATGLTVAVLSTERNPVVGVRCAKLGVPCYQGVEDKARTLQAMLQEHGLRRERVVFVGNDVNDAACMRQAGCAIAVADAHPEVRAAAHLVLQRPGGRGAVREVCDLICDALNASDTTANACSPSRAARR
ncbi:MAG: acylneuraminate cytidylyltransferase [Candidatus Omnitrophica bacterium]|nr:acylneuraminate cytidylyltransferase [Candidatus Omnitrophota bacterium]